MNRQSYAAALATSSLIALALAGCFPGAAEPPSDDTEGDLAEDAEAVHEATCLDTSNDGIPDYDAQTYLGYNAGTCGGNYGVERTSPDASYGVSTCPNQYRVRFGLASGWKTSQAYLSWAPGAPQLNSANCGVALVRGTFWARRISDGVWVHLADTEHTGQWKSNQCVLTPVQTPGFPFVDPKTYSEIHVAADASYLFVRQPVRVGVRLTPPPC